MRKLHNKTTAFCARISEKDRELLNKICELEGLRISDGIRLLIREGAMNRDMIGTPGQLKYPHRNITDAPII